MCRRRPQASNIHLISIFFVPSIATHSLDICCRAAAFVTVKKGWNMPQPRHAPLRRFNLHVYGVIADVVVRLHGAC
jgi:hypothetical protein